MTAEIISPFEVFLISNLNSQRVLLPTREILPLKGTHPSRSSHLLLPKGPLQQIHDTLNQLMREQWLNTRLKQAEYPRFLTLHPLNEMLRVCQVQRRSFPQLPASSGPMEPN